jgi:histidinol-phosphate aminotransferase
VVLDEAYIEFSKIESKMSWVKKHDNLIILRTFSKRAGNADTHFFPIMPGNFKIN